MNPRVSKAGRSFKGLALYLSHDKDRNGCERLGFVEFVNLPLAESGAGVSDCERAAKVMAFTAMHWEDLQRAAFAGDPKNDGKSYRRPPRPIKKPVYSYSLRFSPDDREKITPELLKNAAHESLAVLGMDDLQAVIIEHRDFSHVVLREDIDLAPEDLLREAARQHGPLLGIGGDVEAMPADELRARLGAAMERHDDAGGQIDRLEITLTPDSPIAFSDDLACHGSHVHVMVNRVDAANGRARSYSRDQLKLSVFAEEYGRRHGLKKVSQRIVNNARRDKGEIVLYQGRPRADYERMRAYRGKSRQAVERQRAAQQEKDKRQLNERQKTRREAFVKKQAEAYAPAREHFSASLSASRRVISLEHMGAVFKVLTRLKQRLTGELARALTREKMLRRSLDDLKARMADELASFDAGLAQELLQQGNVHGAQLKLDEEYFAYLRTRRKSETAGEAGRKAFGAKAQQPYQDGQRPLPVSMKAQYLEEQRQARKDRRGRKLDQIARSLGKKEPVPDQSQEQKPVRDKTKSYSRKDERGKHRDKTRKRKSRPRSMKRKR